MANWPEGLTSSGESNRLMQNLPSSLEDTSKVDALSPRAFHTEDMDCLLSDFEGLPVKIYRIRAETSSTPNSWLIGNLAEVQGPKGKVFFHELWSQNVQPDDQRELSEVYGKILANQSTRWHLRFRWIASKRTIIHIGSFDKDKRTVEGVLVDVSDVKMPEIKTYEEERMSALGLMAGGIAHDFNNLLCAILSFARLAQDELYERPPAWHDINEVIKAAEAAEALTRQILNFARVKESSGKTVDLNKRLAELSSILVRLLGKSIHLSLKTSPLPALVSIDPVQFDQVVLNLALNARDAMGPEGGRLIVSLEPDEAASNRVLLIIQDTGKGVEPDIMERIFEPFFTTKSKGQGTGLGLANCQAIVDRFGGSIRVESSPGEGTRFTVSWPLAEAQ